MRTFPVLLLCATAVFAQNGPSPVPTPRDYRGVQVRIDGIFVTPVPNAPFQATVQIVSHEKLPDGSEHVVQTTNHIARSSSGRIRNERRQLVPAGYKGEPRLLSCHLYDPTTRLNIFLDPFSRLARESTVPEPPRPAAQPLPPGIPRDGVPGVTVTDLGQQSLDGVALTGTRKTRIIPAEHSGTGQPVTITDEYWYSPELSIYMIIRHNDPRTGEQLVAVSEVKRAEPPADEMSVPAEYKVVDETPPARVPAVNAITR